MQDYSVCLAKKSQVSPPPAAEQMVQPVPRQGGHSSSPTHPNKGWKEPLEVRESSHGHSGGEKRQLEPPQLQFSIGISPGTQMEGYLHPHHVHSVQGRDATGDPSSLHVGHTDEEVVPARAWARDVDALLFSSALSPARIREM